MAKRELHNLQILSKSNLTAFRQCPKRLWFEVYRRNEAVNATDATRRMAEGDKIGEIARVLCNPNGDGRLIDIKAQGVDEAIRTTADILPDRRPIFEAGFKANGARCFVDILLPSGTELEPQWRMFSYGGRAAGKWRLYVQKTPQPN